MALCVEWGLVVCQRTTSGGASGVRPRRPEQVRRIRLGSGQTASRASCEQDWNRNGVINPPDYSQATLWLGKMAPGLPEEETPKSQSIQTPSD